MLRPTLAIACGMLVAAGLSGCAAPDRATDSAPPGAHESETPTADRSDRASLAPDAGKTLPEAAPPRDSAGPRTIAPQPRRADPPVPIETAPPDRSEPTTPSTVAPENEPTQETEADEPPRYVRILRALRDGFDARVDAATHPPVELHLTTLNVHRLRLTRDELPLARGRSTVVRIDGQSMEWAARYDLIEIERNVNGFWIIVDRYPPPD